LLKQTIVAKKKKAALEIQLVTEATNDYQSYRREQLEKLDSLLI
jgi:hypothetical protein